MPIRIDPHPQGVIIQVKVVPGALRDRIVGSLGDALKITVAQPPQDGRANAAVIALLSEAMGISKKSISILRGQSQARKDVLIAGLSLAQAEQLLERT